MAAGKCCQCGCRVWLTPSHYYAAMEGRSKIAFHCGYGHPQHFCDDLDEINKIRRERDRLKQAAAEQEDRIKRISADAAHLRSKLASVEKEASRVRKRTSNGICPCCSRSFAKLAAHMATKHPEYVQ